MSRIGYLGYFLGCFLTYNVMLGEITFAQSLTDLENAAKEQSLQIERDQSQESLQREQELDALKHQPPSQEKDEKKRQNVAENKKEQCFDIRQITYKGNRLLKNKDIDDILVSFSKTCIGASKINAVLKKVTYLYLQKGYIMARAYIPEQNLKSGQLKIVIVEGTLKKFSPAKKSGLGQGQLMTAFPGLEGKPIQLRDMEQGIDQLNRVPSNNAKTSMKPGKKPGETIVEIQNQKKKTWRVGYNQDNLGGKSTGQYKSGLTLGTDDIFGINDVWSLSYGRNNEGVFFDSSAGNHKNDSFSGNVSVPYGYWTFSLGGSYSFYKSDVKGNFLVLNTRGSAQQYSGSVSKVLHRDKTSKTTLSTSLVFKENTSYINEVRIDTSSRKLSVGKLDLSFTKKAFGAAWSFSGGYQHGLKLFGALDDRDTAPTFPTAQFNKFTASASVMKPFKIGKFDFLYNGSFTGQLSNDLLFGSEQIALGGLYSVRGVKSSLYSGNTGGYFRQELSLKLLVQNDFLKKITAEIHPFAAYDYGVTRGEENHGISHGSMSGYAVGLKGKKGLLSFEAAYGNLLHSYDGISKNSGLFYLKGSLNF